MQTIAIIIIAIIVLFILAKDHICFTKQENNIEDNDDERPCYHTGDWYFGDKLPRKTLDF